MSVSQHVFSMPLVNWNGEAAPVTREPPGRVRPMRQSPHRVGAGSDGRCAAAELRPRERWLNSSNLLCAWRRRARANIAAANTATAPTPPMGAVARAGGATVRSRTGSCSERDQSSHAGLCTTAQVDARANAGTDCQQSGRSQADLGPAAPVSSNRTARRPHATSMLRTGRRHLVALGTRAPLRLVRS